MPLRRAIRRAKLDGGRIHTTSAGRKTQLTIYGAGDRNLGTWRLTDAAYNFAVMLFVSGPHRKF